MKRSKRSAVRWPTRAEHYDLCSAERRTRADWEQRLLEAYKQDLVEQMSRPGWEHFWTKQERERAYGASAAMFQQWVYRLHPGYY